MSSRLPLIPLPLSTGVDWERQREDPIVKIVKITNPETRITVTLVQAGGEWRVESRDDYRNECVRMYFDNAYIRLSADRDAEITIPVLNVSLLFAGLDSTQYLQCDITPNELSVTGHGRLVLDYATQMAVKAKASGVTAYDMAAFPEWRVPSPSVELNKLTPYLTLVRGFGYYEARGFTSLLYPCATTEDLLPYVRRAMEWNKMIATTPLQDLEDAIRTTGFDLLLYNNMRKEQWQTVLDSNLPSLRTLMSKLDSSERQKSMRQIFLDKQDKQTAATVGSYFTSIWNVREGFEEKPEGNKKEKEEKYKGNHLIQRIFYLTPDNAPSSCTTAPYRINIRVNDTDPDNALPIVELVEVKQRIQSEVIDY